MSETQSEIGPRIGDQVFEAMQASILNGDYRSGQRLRIRQLAAELGTSVMPVRESLARLEEVGLVETRPHRGAVVKTFTAEELLQVYSDLKSDRASVTRCSKRCRRAFSTAITAADSGCGSGSWPPSWARASCPCANRSPASRRSGSSRPAPTEEQWSRRSPPRSCCRSI